MNKLVGIVMMSAFDSAWSLLKAQSYPILKFTDSAILQQLQDPEVMQYWTERLNFINENLDSQDPSLRAQAQQLIEKIGPRTLDVLMQYIGGSTEDDVQAPPMPFYSSTDRGYNPDKEMSMSETMGLNQAPKGVGVSKPMPKPRRTDDEEDVDPEGGSIAVR